MVRTDRAVFDPGSDTLPARLRSDLDRIVSRYRAYAGTVFVTATAGPAPEDGPVGDEPVMRLAQRRAESVVSYMIRESPAGGLDARFLQAAGKAVPPAESCRLEIFVRVK